MVCAPIPGLRDSGVSGVLGKQTTTVLPPEPLQPPFLVSWSNSSLSLLLHHWTYSDWEEAIVEGGRGGILCTVLEDSSDFQGSG